MKSGLLRYLETQARRNPLMKISAIGTGTANILSMLSHKHAKYHFTKACSTDSFEGQRSFSDAHVGFKPPDLIEYPVRQGFEARLYNYGLTGLDVLFFDRTQSVTVPSTPSEDSNGAFVLGLQWPRDRGKPRFHPTTANN
ncbi:hypothetical protein F4859DRAFT_119745 [Xylaria cf. heliscus]|nr:hypothetical protein F4859DRAFT_119745 [Xylaria cf. heliscus]